MKRVTWVQVLIVTVAGMLVLANWANAQPAPNNCGLNMLCRVRILIVTGDSTFSGDAGFTGNIASPLVQTNSVQPYTANNAMLFNTTGTGDTTTGNTTSGRWACTGTTCAANGAVQVNGSLSYGAAQSCVGSGAGGASAATIGAAGTNCSLTLTPTGTGAVSVAAGFGVSFAGKCDSTGSPGAATCDQGAGRAAIAASAATITITDALVASTSIVVANLQANDGTCTSIKHVVPGSGSFVITTNAACTGNTNVAWYLASK